MKNKVKNALEWTKKHKVEIGFCAVAAVSAVGSIVLYKKFADPVKIMDGIKDVSKTAGSGIGSKYLDIHDIGIGELDTAIAYSNGTVELWMDNVSLKDIGELGVSLCDHFAESNGVSEDSKIWMLMNVYPNEVE